MLSLILPSLSFYAGALGWTHCRSKLQWSLSLIFQGNLALSPLFIFQMCVLCVCFVSISTLQNHLVMAKRWMVCRGQRRGVGCSPPLPEIPVASGVFSGSLWALAPPCVLAIYVVRFAIAWMGELVGVAFLSYQLTAILFQGWLACERSVF